MQDIFFENLIITFSVVVIPMSDVGRLGSQLHHQWFVRYLKYESSDMM